MRINLTLRELRQHRAWQRYVKSRQWLLWLCSQEMRRR